MVQCSLSTTSHSTTNRYRIMKLAYKILSIFAATGLFALTSCDQPYYPVEGDDQGTLSTSSLTVDVDDSETIITKSSIVDVASFTVQIYDSKEVLRGEWKYGNMPETVTLPVGAYTINVFNATQQDAAFDAPYYYATKTFTVKKNAITEIGTMLCKLQNIKVSIKYSPDLLAVLGDDAKVDVEVAAKNHLIYSANETRAGYFRHYPDNTTLVATFSGTVAGAYIEEMHTVVTNIEAGKHYLITFTYKPTPYPTGETGGFSTDNFTINSGVTVVPVTRNIVINDEIIDPFDYLTLSTQKLKLSCKSQSKTITVKASSDWTVTSDMSWCTVQKGDGNFTVTVTENSADVARNATINVTMGSISKLVTVEQDKYSSIGEAPSFASDYIDLTSGKYNNYADFDAEHPASVTISAPNGVASFHVSIRSDALSQAELQSVGLDSEFNLATGLADNGTDLTNPLANLGFPVATGGTTPEGTTYQAVVNATELNFDITSFMALLAALGNGQHDFVLTVTDNAGQTGETTIRIEVK